MHPKVRILSSREQARFDEDGRAYVDLRTTWKFGDKHGPFYDYARKDGWTLQDFEERTRAHVNELAQLPE